MYHKKNQNPKKVQKKNLEAHISHCKKMGIPDSLIKYGVETIIQKMNQNTSQ